MPNARLRKWLGKCDEHVRTRGFLLPVLMSVKSRMLASVSLISLEGSTVHCRSLTLSLCLSLDVMILFGKYFGNCQADLSETANSLKNETCQITI